MKRIGIFGLCACLVAVCLLFAACDTIRYDTLEIHMIDVGNADSFLVRQGDATMLIDGGEATDGDHIVSYLHTQGVERLDAVVISHPHTDHIGGLEQVIRAYPTATRRYGRNADA